MAADLVHPDGRPDRPRDSAPTWPAICVAGPGPELADLLDGLPDPVKVDVIAALAACGPPIYTRLPATWPSHPDAEFMRLWSLREVVADRRVACSGRLASPWPARQPIARP
jgi:hypothetical protein